MEGTIMKWIRKAEKCVERAFKALDVIKWNKDLLRFTMTEKQMLKVKDALTAALQEFDKEE